MKFKLFGTQIEVSFLFLAFLTFVIFADKSGYALPMFFAVTLHEASHLVCMRVLGCQPKAVRLIPAQIAVLRDFSLSRKKEILISVSGSFINIFLFFLAFNFNTEFAIINLIFGVFNMLPLKGLDGGEILVVLITRSFGVHAAERTLKAINIIMGIIGIAAGVTLLFKGTFNISVIIISIYFLLTVVVKL